MTKFISDDLLSLGSSELIVAEGSRQSHLLSCTEKAEEFEDSGVWRNFPRDKKILR